MQVSQKFDLKEPYYRQLTQPATNWWPQFNGYAQPDEQQQQQQPMAGTQASTMQQRQPPAQMVAVQQPAGMFPMQQHQPQMQGWETVPQQSTQQWYANSPSGPYSSPGNGQAKWQQQQSTPISQYGNAQLPLNNGWNAPGKHRV